MTFHQFPRFPFDIRVRIWELAVEPRTIEVRIKKEYGTRGEVLGVTTSTPVPAILHACQEARNQALYQAVNFHPANAPRCIWLNFAIDMISIGDTYFDDIESSTQVLIRRLRFERRNDESFFHVDSQELRNFSNAEQIHVICKDGPLAWQKAWECLDWPCPKQNLRFIDKETGQMATGDDLDRLKAGLMAMHHPWQRD
ncbi:hypothetical protein BJX99DRAFT_251271 [Aspergillus californicus]